VSPEEVVIEQLPKSMSAKRRGEVAEQILDALSESGLLVDNECSAVEVGNALVPVETVEAYGLTIRLDANGEASEISSAAGLVVVG
jgi:hypothetical protein